MWQIRRHTNKDVPQAEDSHDSDYVVEQVNGPDVEWTTVVPRSVADELAAGIESAMKCCWSVEEYPATARVEECKNHGPAAVALAKYREASRG